MTLPAAIAVLGPTGSGKSDFAFELARRLPVEIISVDSAQVYRGLDIGTAKPSADEQLRVPHHLLDIREPEQVYSAGEFREDVLALLPEIVARGRVPLLVGGTMLYFRTLFRGIASLPVADPVVRADLDARAAREGWPALHALLAQRDPAAASRIHVHDAQRIQRALEVLQVSGKSLSEHWEKQAPVEDFSKWQIIALDPVDRARLHVSLERRLTHMLEAGMVDEVTHLLRRPGITPDSPAMRLVGYRQLLDHCQGRQSLAQAAERALHATRQLAKRQMTWLRSATFLPDECRLIRIDAFDGAARERLAGALIKTTSTP